MMKNWQPFMILVIDLGRECYIQLSSCSALNSNIKVASQQVSALVYKLPSFKLVAARSCESQKLSGRVIVLRIILPLQTYSSSGVS